VPGIVGRIAEALGIEVPAEARDAPTTTAA
jgi:hypothetical protein